MKMKKQLNGNEKYSIKEYLAILRKIEQEVAGMDRYVQYSITKYRPFIFNI